MTQAIRRVPRIQQPANYNFGADGKVIIMGQVVQDGFVEMVFMETEINGTALSFTEAQPFRETRLSTGSISAVGVASHVHHGLAIENASNPGEFLFVQHNSAAAGATTARFSFGFNGDSVNSGNIAGVALDDSADGRVRVQISGKLLPGLFSGLRRGVSYGAGANGGLAEYGGTGRIIGMASSGSDLIYYGADSWR